MKIHDLYERYLAPDKDTMDSIREILDIGVKVFQKRIEEDDTVEEDDAEALAQALNDTTTALKKEGIITFVVQLPITRSHVPYINSAMLTRDHGIFINLDYEYIEEFGIDFDEFVRYILYTISHEAIHVSQKKKMGDEKFQSIKSKYELGNEKADKKKITDPKERNKITMPIYLGDPQEIQAHAHDLAMELIGADKPLEALKNINYYKKYLPTWKKYTEYFQKDDKVLKRLLKLTLGYLEGLMNENK